MTIYNFVGNCGTKEIHLFNYIFPALKQTFFCYLIDIDLQYQIHEMFVLVLDSTWKFGAKGYFFGKIFSTKGQSLYDETLYSMKEGQCLNDEVFIYLMKYIYI